MAIYETAGDYVLPSVVAGVKYDRFVAWRKACLLDNDLEKQLKVLSQYLNILVEYTKEDFTPSYFAYVQSTSSGGWKVIINRELSTDSKLFCLVLGVSYALRFPIARHAKDLRISVETNSQTGKLFWTSNQGVSVYNQLSSWACGFLVPIDWVEQVFRKYVKLPDDRVYEKAFSIIRAHHIPKACLDYTWQLYQRCVSDNQVATKQINFQNNNYNEEDDNLELVLQTCSVFLGCLF